MYLKSLRLKGFKSFPRQTMLVFEPGVGVVIGPNGSGKSNLSDAVTWALGEQSPTNLRGASMQDVIFAGSDGRRPVASAEVELTFDNRDGALALPTDEVSIMRRVTRDGSSQYFINQSSCRLTDVVELMAPVGLGKELHSIIGQGRVEAFLAGKPEDRRSQIEEAAGLGAYKRRRDRAELKLREVRRNLEQAASLEREVSTQLTPLRRQASAAEQLHAIEADLGETRARLLTGELAAVDTEAQAVRLDLAGIEAERTKAELGLEQVAAARATEEDAFARRVAERERRTQRLLRARLLDARLNSNGQLIAQRLRLVAEVERAAEVERQRLLLELSVAPVEADGEPWRAVEAQLAAALAEAEARHTDARESLATARDSLARQRAALSQLVVERESALSAVARLTRRHEELTAEQDRLVAHRQLLDTERRETVATSQLAADEQRRLADALRAAQAAATAAAESAQTAQDDLAAADERQRAAAREAGSIEADVAHLRASLRDLSDVDAVSLDTAKEYGGTVALAGVLTCPPGLERALAAALTQTAGGLAVPAAVDHWSLLAALKRAGVGMARLLVTPRQLSRPALFSGAEPLLDAIGADGRPEVEAALADVVVVDDLRGVPLDFSGLAVTRDGAYYRPSSGQLGLAAGVTTAVLLERRSALTSLEASLISARKQAESLTAELALARAREAAARETADTAAATVRSAQTAADQAAHQTAALRARLAELDDLGARAGQRIETLTLESAEARASGDDAAATAAQALFEIERLRPAGDASEVRLRREEDQYLQAQSELTSRRVELEERQAAAQRAAKEREAAQARAAAGRARLLELEGRLAELPRARQACQALLERIASLRHHAARLLAGLGEPEASGADLDRAGLRALAEREAGLRRRLDEAGERRTAEQVALARLDDRRQELAAELEALSEQLDRAGFAPPADASEEQALRDRLERCDRRRAQIGPVNPLAAAECAELEERATFFREQRRDLERSITDLEQLIAELAARVDAEFAETFAAVKEQFVHMVSVLFPGGRGSLELVAADEEGVPGGVAVSVKPAKKLGQRLQLLSGGERALVAIAFLMALVLARPSPLYILDEVEAALDDVNIGRLVKLLRDYRDRTQFLVITHQKPTMDAADVLYGVTMGPDGGSQVVSARMAAAALDEEAGVASPPGPATHPGEGGRESGVA